MQKKSTRFCAICGKEYPYCKSHDHRVVFRWQDVACCPEHGVEYYNRYYRSQSAEEKSGTTEDERPQE